MDFLLFYLQFFNDAFDSKFLITIQTFLPNRVRESVSERNDMDIKRLKAQLVNVAAPQPVLLAQRG